MLKLTRTNFDRADCGPVLVNPASIFAIQQFSTGDGPITNIRSTGVASVTVLESLEEVANAIAIATFPQFVVPNRRVDDDDMPF